jgi:hypothetical protein
VRFLEVFDHYLKAAPAPQWLSDGVPYLKKDEQNSPPRTEPAKHGLRTHEAAYGRRRRTPAQQVPDRRPRRLISYGMMTMTMFDAGPVPQAFFPRTWR